MATQAQTNGTLALEQKNRVIITPAQDEITIRKLRVAAYRLVDRQLRVVQSEAIIVRTIYEKYLSGISMEFIRDQLICTSNTRRSSRSTCSPRAISLLEKERRRRHALA